MVAGLTQPTSVAWAPDGRMFVVEKEGVLKVVAPGAQTATTVLDIRNEVPLVLGSRAAGAGRGLQLRHQRLRLPVLHVRAAPADAGPGGGDDLKLDRVRLGAQNQVLERTTILGTESQSTCGLGANDVDCLPSEGLTHSVGSVVSAPDGTLWATHGEGDALEYRAYDEASMAGKLFHIDRNGNGLPGHPFCPSDNNLTHNCTKMWGKGLRQPFRFTMRPNGGLVLGDVGWREREEINLISAGGRSYGWPCYEGTQRTPTYEDSPECAVQYQLPHTPPQYEYLHTDTNAVLGGPEYVDDSYPAGYQGSIFYGDYAAGFIKRLTLNGSGQVTGSVDFATGVPLVDLELAPSGDLAYVSFGDGVPGRAACPGSSTRPATAHRSRWPAARPPAARRRCPCSSPARARRTPMATRSPTTGTSATGRSPAPPTSHTYSSDGVYTARLTVDDGRGLTDSDTVTIAVDRSAPVANIDSPANESLYRDGDTIQVQGSATDHEEGDLPASAFQWTGAHHPPRPHAHRHQPGRHQELQLQHPGGPRLRLLLRGPAAGDRHGRPDGVANGDAAARDHQLHGGQLAARRAGELLGAERPRR